VTFAKDVAVVGGCGHVGLPLALAFASRGLDVAIFDINEDAARCVQSGVMPFRENGAAEVLEAVVGRNLSVSTDPGVLSTAESVVFVVGTPVDEHLNPDPAAVPEAVEAVSEHLRNGQLIVLRSTLYPGVTSMVERQLRDAGLDLDVAFCPERIAEGKAMTELFELPQIVSGRTTRSLDRAAKLFSSLTSETVRLLPEEAELAKLFTNSWRYLKFAAANQLYRIANDFGLDYERIRSALAYNYPRAADLPAAGFAAGPCLLKDTMQLAAFNNNDFLLGHASMTINEGLPLYVVDRMAKRWDLSALTIGIAGMAFKSESDDIRSSLSYKLRRILRFQANRVICSDHYRPEDPELVPLDVLLDESHVIVIGAPHDAYRNLNTTKPVVDIWGITGSGVRV
jgi:UDP-N-acetyl-D-mannosaminuronic acid dehydrogenase